MPDEQHDGQDIHISRYVDAAVRTSTRSREILILIIIASVLVFGSFWNSREHSWINERIAIHSKALQFAKGLERIPTQTETQSKGVTPSSEGLRHTAQNQEKSLAERAGDTKGYQDVATFLDERPSIHDAKDIEDALARLQTIKTEHVLYLKLPFFGIVIDVNDLGMLGGFTLWVLLVWFRSSLWHEEKNLRITIDEAGASRHYYQSLAMQQVLTTPPPINEKDKPAIRWSGIVILLTILPLLVQATVVYNDIKTFDIGGTVSHDNTIVAVVAGAGFLVAILVFTILCFQLLDQIAKAWQDYAKVVREKDGRA